MTGPEIAATAAGVAKAVGSAGRALGGDADERKRLLDLAQESKAMEVAAHAKADRVAIRQLVLTKIMGPLASWVGYKSDYFAPEGQFADDLTEAIKDIPPGDVQSPAPVIAAQAMEGLSFSLEEPDLKAMYLRLLATASDSRIISGPHPSFAQVIKQLSGPEARWIKLVISSPGVPAVEIRWDETRDAENIGWFTLTTHVVQARDEPLPDEWAMYVDNWIRLGLVTATYVNYLTQEGAYDWVETSPAYHAAVSAQQLDRSGREFKTTFEKGVIKPTAFGKAFARSVITSSTNGQANARERDVSNPENGGDAGVR